MKYIFILFSLALGGCNPDVCEPITPGDSDKHSKNANQTAKALRDYLDDHAQQAAIVARAGGDLSTESFQNPANQKYTHAGLVWKNTEDDDKWTFKHLLNICEGPASKIANQSLLEFFDDNPYFYDFKVGIPSKSLQKNLAKVLESELPDTLHNSVYNKISNPYNTQFQNSNEWLLSVIAASQNSKVKTFEQAQKEYARRGFTPSSVYVGFWRGIFSAFSANSSISDHTQEEKNSGWYHFVSVESIFEYLGKTAEVKEICHTEGCNIKSTELNQ